MPTRPAHLAAAAAAAAVLLTGCGGADPGAQPSHVEPTNPTYPSAAASSPTSPAPTGTAPTSAAPTSAAPTQSAAPAADTTIAIEVRDGQVTPSGRAVRVRRGQTVLLQLTSDTAESIHLHGYDKEVAVKPGKTGRLVFVADQSGVFEIETHETAKLAVKLIVA